MHPKPMGSYPTMIRLLVVIVVLHVPYGTAGATTANLYAKERRGAPTMSAMRSGLITEYMSGARVRRVLIVR